jgi:type I restriction enzyme, R subunit
MAPTAATASKEDSYAEQPALEWLEELGWERVHGPDIAPDGETPERADWSDVVLKERLRAKISELNPELPVSAVDQAVGQAIRAEYSEVIDDHAHFHRLLVDGFPVSWTDESGEEKDARVRLVDLEKTERNEFLVINQVTISISSKTRRPDVLLYVNGLPLGQIELKNPTDKAATPESAVNQVNHYRSTIPDLYRFVEVIGVSDLLLARMGTITTPAEHFAEWKAMDPKAGEGKSQLEVMLREAFAPERFLDIVENFVLYEQDGGGSRAILAKYHQVDAVNRAIEATVRAQDEDGRAGVVWHTQGAGKSYTMAFYAMKVRRDPRLRNPTIVALTDRRDLDEQLLQTFAAVPVLADAVKQAKKISTGPENLHELLQVPAGSIVHTTIQKFAAPEAEMPVLSERSNIIVLADEAHRSQNEQLARNLLKALPNAIRIGFTGTPIEKGDRSTRLNFGDYISIYNIGRAVDDGATVPIFYENRNVPLDIADPELLEEVEEALESEEEEAATKLIRSEAKLDRVVGSSDRVAKVAADIAKHFEEREAEFVKTLDDFPGGKALVVGMTRRICAQLTDELRSYLGDDAVTCVISAAATDDEFLSRFRRSKQEMRQVADDFKSVEHELKVVVVQNMWLTGFDVPPLHTLYIDRPMKDHGLLQAIARVNRVFRDKPGGLVVDYIGIGEDLRAALPSYAEEDVEDAMVPLDSMISKMNEKHGVLQDFFHGTNFEKREQMSDGERATLFAKVVGDLLLEDDKTKRYLDEYAAFSKLFALVSPDPAAAAIENDADWFGDVAKAARKLKPPEHEADLATKQAVKQFYSDGLAAGEIKDVFEIAGKERPEISVLSDEFLDDLTKKVPDENLQMAFLRKLLDDEIKSRGRTNQMQAQLFSDELEELLARYRNRQLSSAEVVEKLVELAKKMREARHRHEELGLSEEESAFYDALAGKAEDISEADPELVEIVKDLVEAIKNDLSVDWTSHESAEAAIRVKVKRLLRKHHYKPPVVASGGSGGGSPGNGRGSLDYAADLVLQQARVLYKYWPEVGFTDAAV